MTGYKLAIVNEGRHPLETIVEIQDLNVQKKRWSIEDVKSVLGPIYVVGRFETYSKTNKTKRIPKILRAQTFEKILSLIIESGVRFIDITINGWNIKFYTRNPKHYMYEYYLNFSENRSPIKL